MHVIWQYYLTLLSRGVTGFAPSSWTSSINVQTHPVRKRNVLEVIEVGEGLVQAVQDGFPDLTGTDSEQRTFSPGPKLSMLHHACLNETSAQQEPAGAWLTVPGSAGRLGALLFLANLGELLSWAWVTLSPDTFYSATILPLWELDADALDRSLVVRWKGPDASCNIPMGSCYCP